MGCQELGRCLVALAGGSAGNSSSVEGGPDVGAFFRSPGTHAEPGQPRTLPLAPSKSAGSLYGS